MRSGKTIAVIIPAFNEEESVGKVIAAIPDWVDRVIVVDNGSTDGTAGAAGRFGARVVYQPEPGYGAACLAGIAFLNGKGPDSVDIVVFLDADFSDRPSEMDRLVDPIIDRGIDMVIGSRILGRREPGALTAQARFGNMLSCFLIRMFWRQRYTDLGPFRAISHDALNRLEMRDRGYGWTVEMQIKAARGKLKIAEVPVSYHRRIGKSKISGTITGAIGAGIKILYTIFAAALDTFVLQQGRRKTRNRLIVFTRYPEAGTTKTRLIPALGPDGAAELHRRMASRMLVTVRQFINMCPGTVEVRFESGNKGLLREWLGSDLSYRYQGEGDLGMRMFAAFKDAFRKRAEAAVIIGTDCPDLSSQLMQQAFVKLAARDLVLGPASDGGYYLIGLRRTINNKSMQELFSDILWGTGKVLKKTIEKAQDMGLSSAFLDELNDVDVPEDILIWEHSLETETARTFHPPISVIIPALNEENNITASITSARAASNAEIIVVDGGSSDGTVEKARAAGARVLTSQPGKASQMNAGASAATGDILLFLHADTLLPESYESLIQITLSDEKTVCGAFELKLYAPGILLRIIEKTANIRSRRRQLPYGDQCFFIRADLFQSMGGFKEMPLMEDVELIRRLRRKGNIAIVPVPVRSSARRYVKIGPLRTALINKIAMGLYNLGLSPALIARFYNRERGLNPSKK